MATIHVRTRGTSGFTLVEILIVLVIMGILASIVIPRYSEASDAARKEAMVTQLRDLRQVIEAYRAQHDGGLPSLLTNQWASLTAKTNRAGNPPGAGEMAFGPYLTGAPANPMTGATTVVPVGTAPATTTGWYWDAATSKLHGANKQGARTDDGVTVLP